ncbi:MAG TPA: DinB family protein [Candidatus Dormibacteraeota bacterium]|nr:DinB family protein [Candidatus Dormibacteraeota bacterium]HEV2477741.1 DinB family protein [Candidatus Dormibacteraeota bacterium]
MKVRGAAASLADEFDTVLASVIEVAESCDDEQWKRRVIEEERSVGVLFDHIAAGNDQSVEWATALLRGRDVEVDPGLIDSENAAHAREARDRTRSMTVERLRKSTARTSKFLHGLTDEQLKVTQTFGWLGPQDVAFLVRQACRHPQRHLQGIRQALDA